MWDLFELNPNNGGPGKRSDLGEVLTHLDVHTLTKLRGWLDENKDRAIECYGQPTWVSVRGRVGITASWAAMPPTMELPDAKDGLPFQFWAVRTDGKTWDLNRPIRAELLRRAPRYFSERDYAKLLGISRRAYQRLRGAIRDEHLSLDSFTPDILERIVLGKRRGPGRKR